MNDERAIRSIAIAGGGIVGLSAANAFARALPGSDLTVIEIPPDAAALADHLPTARPNIARFHALIGIDERELVRAGVASHHLGTIFENWPATSEPWVHALGNYGKPAAAIPFDQIWVRAKRAGKALAYDRYSVGAALARADKFVHPARDPEFVGSRFEYGLRLDPDLYRTHLRDHAEGAGVRFISADIGEVERREDGGIAALQLATGGPVKADWFIDCTGPTARLIGAVDDSIEDWSAWMPFDSITLMSEAANAIPTPADRVCGDERGWTIDWPLRGRALKARVGSAGDTKIARYRRLRPFVRNVLALGDAATALDPLHGFQLELVHRAILLALELLPGRDFHPLETDEYNRRAEQVTRRVRDFIAVHYVQHVGVENAPDSLARTLDQYGYRGRMPFHEDESVTRDSWTAVLLALGVVPDNLDPASGLIPFEQAISAMERLAQEIDRTVAELPAYVDYLAGITR